ncbi:uncharacterized protein LOC122818205 [Drosophila biarmipes]|uniref:uncharacterized protein LOC122818205 n=1 Tax=Drosophila biarmipes TaxID=125945 RepID=UPI001CDAA53F|nr:uncharacterized protein LOC122818205 [Drosophila biarmipes]
MAAKDFPKKMQKIQIKQNKHRGKSRKPARETRRSTQTAVASVKNEMKSAKVTTQKAIKSKKRHKSSNKITALKGKTFDGQGRHTPHSYNLTLTKDIEKTPYHREKLTLGKKKLKESRGN